MAAIDAKIVEVAATLDQKLREANAEPEETESPEAARDADVLHPSTTEKLLGRSTTYVRARTENVGAPTHAALGTNRWHL